MAGQDIDLVANVKNSTCKSGISNQGNIDLGVVGVGYFSDNVTPESYQPGGKSSLSQYQTVHYRELAMCLISYILILEPLAVSWLLALGKYLLMKFRQWICPYISRHLLSLNPLQARCRRYSRGER